MKINKLFTMFAVASLMLGTLAFNACSTSETGTTSDTNMETETGTTGGETTPDTTGTEMNDDNRPNSPDDDMGTETETQGTDSMNEVK